jgi:prepilin-type N-terminal cleavage/methylation domain-containing protein
MMMKRLRKTTHSNLCNTRGYTLIELMVAMIILAMGLFAVVQMQLTSLRGNSYAKERTEAQQIASGVIEELRAKGLEWIRDDSRGIDINFSDVFKSNYKLVLIDPPPSAGQSINGSSLSSILSYMGQTISSNENFASAQMINVRGKVLGAALDNQSAIYRVHYIAHRLSSVITAPLFDAVRVTVYVSWDSKDFGEQQVGSAQLNWADSWQNTDNFWRRHIVAETTTLTQIFY